MQDRHRFEFSERSKNLGDVGSAAASLGAQTVNAQRKAGALSFGNYGHRSLQSAIIFDLGVSKLMDLFGATFS
jgi:hypothetical protein